MNVRSSVGAIINRLVLVSDINAIIYDIKIASLIEQPPGHQDNLSE